MKLCTVGVANKDWSLAVRSTLATSDSVRSLHTGQRNSFGSVYFNEDLQEAEDSLNETLGRYNALLEKLSDSQKEQVLRSIGLKMEELKAQRQVIQDIIRED
ncbi:hypothetical protein HOLleu_19109 [Holothuria leucospilota]|uniref:Uncharacterized protein n=1 Tax=Holothuria leucospilota TaxID=206669 RepID=A0A9Q1C4A1_HOLLE|nr:hypothetical protein HOLleu_19109 [Holothuria leucospilota]